MVQFKEFLTQQLQSRSKFLEPFAILTYPGPFDEDYFRKLWSGLRDLTTLYQQTEEYKTRQEEIQRQAASEFSLNDTEEETLDNIKSRLKGEESKKFNNSVTRHSFQFLWNIFLEGFNKLIQGNDKERYQALLNLEKVFRLKMFKDVLTNPNTDFFESLRDILKQLNVIIKSEDKKAGGKSYDILYNLIDFAIRNNDSELFSNIVKSILSDIGVVVEDDLNIDHKLPLIEQLPIVDHVVSKINDHTYDWRQFFINIQLLKININELYSKVILDIYPPNNLPGFIDSRYRRVSEQQVLFLTQKILESNNFTTKEKTLVASELYETHPHLYDRSILDLLLKNSGLESHQIILDFLDKKPKLLTQEDIKKALELYSKKYYSLTPERQEQEKSPSTVFDEILNSIYGTRNDLFDREFLKKLLKDQLDWQSQHSSENNQELSYREIKKDKKFFSNLPAYRSMPNPKTRLSRILVTLRNIIEQDPSLLDEEMVDIFLQNIDYEYLEFFFKNIVSLNPDSYTAKDNITLYQYAKYPPEGSPQLTGRQAAINAVNLGLETCPHSFTQEVSRKHNEVIYNHPYRDLHLQSFEYDQGVFDVMSVFSTTHQAPEPENKTDKGLGLTRREFLLSLSRLPDKSVDDKITTNLLFKEDLSLFNDQDIRLILPKLKGDSLDCFMSKLIEEKLLTRENFIEILSHLDWSENKITLRLYPEIDILIKENQDIVNEEFVKLLAPNFRLDVYQNPYAYYNMKWALRNILRYNPELLESEESREILELTIKHAFSQELLLIGDIDPTPYKLEDIKAIFQNPKIPKIVKTRIADDLVLTGRLQQPDQLIFHYCVLHSSHKVKEATKRFFEHNPDKTILTSKYLLDVIQGIYGPKFFQLFSEIVILQPELLNEEHISILIENIIKLEGNNSKALNLLYLVRKKRPDLENPKLHNLLFRLGLDPQETDPNIIIINLTSSLELYLEDIDPSQINPETLSQLSRQQLLIMGRYLVLNSSREEAPELLSEIFKNLKKSKKSYDLYSFIKDNNKELLTEEIILTLLNSKYIQEYHLLLFLMNNRDDLLTENVLKEYLEQGIFEEDLFKAFLYDLEVEYQEEFNPIILFDKLSDLAKKTNRKIAQKSKENADKTDLEELKDLQRSISSILTPKIAIELIVITPPEHRLELIKKLSRINHDLLHGEEFLNRLALNKDISYEELQEINNLEIYQEYDLVSYRFFVKENLHIDPAKLEESLKEHLVLKRDGENLSRLDEYLARNKLDFSNPESFDEKNKIYYPNSSSSTTEGLVLMNDKGEFDYPDKFLEEITALEENHDYPYTADFATSIATEEELDITQTPSLSIDIVNNPLLKACVEMLRIINETGLQQEFGIKKESQDALNFVISDRGKTSQIRTPSPSPLPEHHSTLTGPPMHMPPAIPAH